MTMLKNLAFLFFFASKDALGSKQMPNNQKKPLPCRRSFMKTPQTSAFDEAGTLLNADDCQLLFAVQRNQKKTKTNTQTKQKLFVVCFFLCFFLMFIR